MGILDSFYLLFRSDTTDAQKGIKDLELEVDKLAAKGRKRSEEENLQYIQKKKQLAERQKALRDEQKEADKVGQAYVKIAEALGAVVVGYLGIGSVKGFVNALGETQKFQMSLQLLNQWTSISAKSLDAFDSALQSFGGAPGEGLQALKSLHDYFAQLGFPASGLPLIDKLKELGEQLKALPIDQAEKVGKSIGLSDNLILFLRNTPTDKLNTLINLMAKLNGTTEETGKTAAEFSEQWKIATTSVSGYFTEMWDGITKKASSRLEILNDLIQGKFKKGFFDSIFGLIFGESPEHLANSVPKGVDASQLVHPGAGTPDAAAPLGIRNNNPGNLRPGGREASYGTPGAGLSALSNNLRSYGRKGWNTISSIASHWAPPNENNTGAYISALSRDTGFSPDHPLDLSDASTLQKLSSAIIKHENGYNPYNQSQIIESIGIGQKALNTASSFPLNSLTGGASTGASKGATTVSITGDIIVHSQASDAQGISRDIGAALKSQLRNTISNIDDGVLA